jgi:SAM-dependent methyltransferase
VIGRDSSRPTKQSCPVCGHLGSTDFFSATGLPVTCASIFPTREEALAVPRGNLTLTSCNACSFVFNRTFDPTLSEVGARYESSQGASGAFSAFAEGLSRDWIERYGLAGKTVLEVGCGGGDFLARLVHDGVSRGVGIDPLADESKNGADPRLVLIAASFDERSLEVAADALVCRHTLEHVRDVSGFLKVVRHWAARASHRVVLFELPAAERVFAERAFWDTYYEHCNYFTEQTLRHAFELAGFEVLALKSVYGSQYLILEARAADAPSHESRVDVARAQAAYGAYGHDVRSSIARCQAELEQLRDASPPLVVWQGASKTVGFLSMLADASVVDSAVELNPARHGKFLPGSGLAVHAPRELTRLRPGHVVLMNPIYLSEVTAEVRRLGLASAVHSVNTLLE